MITSISWKNVWRNKTRSLVVVTAVTLGTVAGVFVAGLMNGWVKQRIDSSIYTEMGHIKIQNPDFLINEEARFAIKDINKVTQYLNDRPEVEAYSRRSKIMAMASTARGKTGLTLKGINIERDKIVSDIYSRILPNAGTYFESKTRLPQVLISNKTAEMLKIKNYRITTKTIDSLTVLEVPQASIVKLNTIVKKRYTTKKKFKSAINDLWTDKEIKNYAPKLIKAAAYFQHNARVTFSFTKVDGEIAYQTFQVCGVYKTSNTMFDQMSAFVDYKELAKVAGLGNNDFHEISIITTTPLSELNVLRKDIATDLNEQSVLSWKELAPDAGMMADFMQIYYYLVMGIIFFALSFGIINTMLMAILERVKEIGMLMAIGMKKTQVFNMIMLETVFLTITGSVAGMLLGGLLIKITGKTGLNFASVEEGFEAMGWSALVYPSINMTFFFGVIVMVVIVAIISSVIPARKALKLKPIEALRME